MIGDSPGQAERRLRRPGDHRRTRAAPQAPRAAARLPRRRIAQAWRRRGSVRRTGQTRRTPCCVRAAGGQGTHVPRAAGACAASPTDRRAPGSARGPRDVGRGDFEALDLKLLVPTTLKAARFRCRSSELNARLEATGSSASALRHRRSRQTSRVSSSVVRLRLPAGRAGRRPPDSPTPPGTLAPGDLRGSTFTVTSAGRLGGLFHADRQLSRVRSSAWPDRSRPVVRDGRRRQPDRHLQPSRSAIAWSTGPRRPPPSSP